MAREISLGEVKKHRSAKDLWIVIDNNVYDVTKYLDEHPGGADVLVENAGKDATQAFEDVGHSADARGVMKKFKIGHLPANEHQKKSCDYCSYLKSCAKMWPLLVLASAVVIAVAYKKYAT